MKRKQKCGNDKRIENKKKALRAATSAPGQKSLLGMVNNQKAGNSYAKSSPSEETVSAQPTDTLVHSLAVDRRNEVDDDQVIKLSKKDDTVLYRSKKFSVSWLLLSESCLEVKTEMKDKKRSS